MCLGSAAHAGRGAQPPVFLSEPQHRALSCCPATIPAAWPDPEPEHSITDLLLQLQTSEWQMRRLQTLQKLLCLVSRF